MTETDATAAALAWVAANDPELDPICGDNGYPTEIELQRIEHWFDKEPVAWNERIGALLLYVKDRWNYADWGWHETVDRDGTTFYTISTGGWSGNEDLMGALQKAWPYWALLFEAQRAGGHYILKHKLLKETDATTQDTDH